MTKKRFSVQTISVGKSSVDRYWNTCPHTHVTWVGVRLDKCSSGVGYQLPVHAIGNDVGTSVVAPHEGGVDTLDVWRQPGVGQRPRGDLLSLATRQLPVARTYHVDTHMQHNVACISDLRRAHLG